MIDNFEIQYTWVLFLIPLPLLLLLVHPMRVKSASILVSNFEKNIALTAAKPQKAAAIYKKTILERIVLWFVWIMLLCALSSPQIVGKAALVPKNSRSFLILADLSFSMAETDWVVNGKRSSRWNAVKHVMSDFIDKRQGDRIGLVLFGSSAYVQAPFTTDLNVLDALLDDTTVGLAGQTTSIGKAILKGVSLFENDTIPAKVMFLLTDGVDAGLGVSPLDAATIAKEDSIVIYTLGIGSSLGSTDLDETILKQIANKTNGRYFNANNTENLVEVYKTIEALEPIEYQEVSYKPRTLLYHYPLSFAILLLLLYILIATVIRLIKLNKTSRDG